MIGRTFYMQEVDGLDVIPVRLKACYAIWVLY
jgi:hypothetical protein